MDRSEEFKSIIADTEKDIKEVLDFGDYNDLFMDISYKVEGNETNLGQLLENQDKQNPNIQGLVEVHGQLEGIKNVLTDESVSSHLDDESVQNMLNKVDSLEKSCEMLEEKYDVFKVEEKPEAIVRTDYMKINFDIDGFDNKMNFNTLCDIVGVPKGGDSIHRYGSTNVYGKESTVDRGCEVKLIPATVEGSVSPFAVGKVDIGDNRELLFVGHVASDDNGKILPKLENVHFIGTDNADSNIPEYMKNKDTGRCDSLDLNRSELKQFIPYGNKTDGKIDVNASYDNITYDVFKRTGLQIVNTNQYGTYIRNDDLYVLKNECVNLTSNADIAVKTLGVSLSKELENGPTSFDELLVKSDTLAKLSNDKDAMQSVTAKFEKCIDRVEGLNSITERLLDSNGNPEFACNELSLYLDEAVRIRNDVADAFKGYSDYVDGYKADNGAGVTKEEYMQKTISSGIEMYNNALDKSNSDAYDAKSLHIGNKGFVYNGLGIEATKRMPDKDNQTCADDNSVVVYSESGQEFTPFFMDESIDILENNSTFSEKEIVDSAKSIVYVATVSAEYSQCLIDSGMSKEEAANKLEALRSKYFDIPEGVDASEQMEDRIKDYLTEIKDNINAIQGKNDVDTGVVKDEKVNDKTVKDRAKAVYDKVSAKIEVQSKQMGRLAHGDILIIGMSAVQAFSGLIAGEKKYTIKNADGTEKVGYYSTADAIMSTYRVLATSPSAMMSALMYRALNFVCTRTIDIAIRKLAAGDKVEADRKDDSVDKTPDIKELPDGVYAAQNDNATDNDNVTGDENDNGKDVTGDNNEPKEIPEATEEIPVVTDEEAPDGTDNDTTTNADTDNPPDVSSDGDIPNTDETTSPDMDTSNEGRMEAEQEADIENGDFVSDTDNEWQGDNEFTDDYNDYDEDYEDYEDYMEDIEGEQYDEIDNPEDVENVNPEDLEQEQELDDMDNLNDLENEEDDNADVKEQDNPDDIENDSPDEQEDVDNSDPDNIEQKEDAIEPEEKGVDTDESNDDKADTVSTDDKEPEHNDIENQEKGLADEENTRLENDMTDSEQENNATADMLNSPEQDLTETPDATANENMAIPDTEQQMNDGLTDTDKESLVNDINDVLDGTKTMEEAKFSDYLDKNPTETMEIMTDTLSDKLSEAAENGVDVDETIDSVANFAVNITNPLNYDAPTDSLETMGENIRKNNKKDIGDKLDERMAALVGDPSLNYGPVDSGYDDKTDLNHDEVSFEMDGHRVDVDTYKTDDGFERIVTIDYEEVPDSTINESIENAVQDVSNNVDPIVSACTSDKPLEDSVDKYITSNDEIVTKEDLINALEKVKAEIPSVLQNLDLIFVDSDKAVDKIVHRAVDNAINSLIEDITGVNVKETINDIKHDIADKISDAINDMVKDLSGIDVKGTIDELKDKAIDKLCDIINDTLSNSGVSPEMDNFDTPNVDIPEGNGLGDILDNGIEGVGEDVIEAAGEAGAGVVEEAIEALIV